MSEPIEKTLLVERDGPVAILTLNRPRAMNALSGELIDALQAEFDRLAGDRAIRHVYVDGTQVVRDGKVLTVDVEAATAGLIEGQRKRLETVSQRDWAGRTADQLAPPVYGTKERLPQSRPVT